MLLAMINDVRIVLIKLSDQLHTMRLAGTLEEAERNKISRENMDIYAPLANRLGIGQIKWELEDLAFRYLEPEIYQTLAKSLQTKRIDRNRFVHDAIDELKIVIKDAGIKNVDIQGRAKHIYSIHRKMTRKKVDIQEIYDTLAIRIQAPKIEDCYAILGHVHTLWKQIPEEFDDYIARPKPNGYRSLHTAVVGPEQKNLEVQIRTYAMHEEAELGIAAHWHYKEGGSRFDSHERKAAWLRQVLDWQKEITPEEESKSAAESKLFKDRVYVFTPAGDIIDLEQDSTPLDFAYHIHSEVGHRCQGAKINGAIVPLTHKLKLGDKVEVLTGKHAKPSRDWLSPTSGYLSSSRARSKVQHWFKQQDYDKNLIAGKGTLDKELKTLHVGPVDYNKLTEKFPYKTGDDILAAIGSGDLKIGQVINTLKTIVKFPEKTKPVSPTKKAPSKTKAIKGFSIEGLGNLLTNTARCCKPFPGDLIVGYITRTRGVTIHRKDCHNIRSIDEERKDRLVNVSWKQTSDTTYPVNIKITAHSYDNLIKDLTHTLGIEDVNILSLHTKVDKPKNQTELMMTVSISDISSLNKVLDHVKKLANVIEARRQTPK